MTTPTQSQRPSSSIARASPSYNNMDVRCGMCASYTYNRNALWYEVDEYLHSNYNDLLSMDGHIEYCDFEFINENYETSFYEEANAMKANQLDKACSPENDDWDNFLSQHVIEYVEEGHLVGMPDSARDKEMLEDYKMKTEIDGMTIHHTRGDISKVISLLHRGGH